MIDYATLGLLMVGFAVLVTAHLALVVGLLQIAPRCHALVALIVPPLAPIWGGRARMGIRTAFWVAGAVLYAIGWGVDLVRG